MLSAIVLICSLSVTPDIATCNSGNAIDVLRMPAAFSNPVMCFMHGQAYLADTEMGREIRDNERVKVVCVYDIGTLQ